MGISSFEFRLSNIQALCHITYCSCLTAVSNCILLLADERVSSEWQDLGGGFLLLGCHTLSPTPERWSYYKILEGREQQRIYMSPWVRICVPASSQ